MNWKKYVSYKVHFTDPLFNVTDAHRALELLEDYYAKLVVTKPQDQQLKQSVEQVIKIFKSSLFQALLGM